jgi:hypothetical protein
MIRRELILHFELGIGIEIEFGLVGMDWEGRKEGKGMTSGVYIGFLFLFYLLFSVF